MTAESRPAQVANSATGSATAMLGQLSRRLSTIGFVCFRKLPIKQTLGQKSYPTIRQVKNLIKMLWARHGCKRSILVRAVHFGMQKDRKSPMPDSCEHLIQPSRAVFGLVSECCFACGQLRQRINMHIQRIDNGKRQIQAVEGEVQVGACQHHRIRAPRDQGFCFT